jgi:superfamily II DNA/RNA helicase
LFIDKVFCFLARTGGVDDVTQVQTLLFSATMPDWVKKVYFPSFSYCISLQIFCLQLVYNSYSVHGSPLLRDQLGQSFEDLSLLGVWKMGGDFIHLLFGKQIAAKFLKPSRITVDLVGDEKMKASANVKHLLLPGHYTMRTQLVADVISCYGSGGRCIVFTETKNDATELAGALKLGTARALHGDIPQNQREVTLAAFRSGKFHTLVATDVAARGLDINDVQVVIQCEPPRDAETYIHRSGRTGRAGNTGISVMLYDRKKEYMIPQIERKAGFKFERIAPPQPADIAKASAETATGGVLEVADRY